MMKRFFFPLMLICSLVLAAQGSTITHVVQKGETLYSIAKLYNTTVEAILKLNNLSDPSKITVGLVLKIPAPPVATSSYTVKKGDTLFSIARTFSISVDNLKALNKLTSDAIKVGQVLTVPGKADGTTQTQHPTQTTQQTQPVTPKAPVNPQVTKPVPSNVNTGWPCDGRVSYLQGNLQGILITAGPKATVRTVRAGVVVSHGPFRGFGTMIFVRASDGLIYVYGGIARSRVKVGDTLEFGAILGETPSEDANDVFFFVFSGNKALDPAKVPRG